MRGCHLRTPRTEARCRYWAPWTPATQSLRKQRNRSWLPVAYHREGLQRRTSAHSRVRVLGTRSAHRPARPHYQCWRHSTHPCCQRHHHEGRSCFRTLARPSPSREPSWPRSFLCERDSPWVYDTSTGAYVQRTRATLREWSEQGGRWARHPLRGGAVMTTVATAELRRPLNRAIHRAIVARFGEAGCPMTATCNESTVEDTALAWFGEPAHSHPGSRDNFATRCREHRGRLGRLAPDLQPIHRRR